MSESRSGFSEGIGFGVALAICISWSVNHSVWQESGLVEIAALHAGDVFECIDGTYWMVDSKNRGGTIHATAWGRDGEATDFIAGALVRPVMRKIYANEKVENDGDGVSCA